MMYLRKFDSQTAYTAAQSSLILPNVSLVTEDNTVHYNPYVDPSGGHSYVEIGGVKWATMNVGAESISDYGLYFQWGDTQGYTAAQVGNTEGKKEFKWNDYKYWTSDTGSGSSGVTKYNGTDYTVLQSEDDAVTAAWGGNWRMPTTAEFQALGTATTSAWTSSYNESGVSGLVLTSTADTSVKLFFPACGFAVDGSVNGVGYYGFYRSSSLYSSDVSRAYGLYFNSGNKRIYWDDISYRHRGFPVRGVLGA